MDLAVMDLGGGVGIFGTLLIGGVAGWVAEKLTRASHGILTNIVIGIMGAFVGGWIANALDLQLSEIFEGWFWGNVLVSAVGAVLLITVYRMIRGR